MANKYLKPRSIEEWLRLIPYERARKEALENITGDRNRKYKSLTDALVASFSWRRSKQGETYWTDVYSAVIRMENSVKLK